MWRDRAREHPGRVGAGSASLTGSRGHYGKRARGRAIAGAVDRKGPGDPARRRCSPSNHPSRVPGHPLSRFQILDGQCGLGRNEQASQPNLAESIAGDRWKLESTLQISRGVDSRSRPFVLTNWECETTFRTCTKEAEANASVPPNSWRQSTSSPLGSLFYDCQGRTPNLTMSNASYIVAGERDPVPGGRACWATKDRDVLLALSASRARGATRFLVRLNCGGRGAALPITPETPPRPMVRETGTLQEWLNRIS